MRSSKVQPANACGPTERGSYSDAGLRTDGCRGTATRTSLANMSTWTSRRWGRWARSAAATTALFRSRSGRLRGWAGAPLIVALLLAAAPYRVGGQGGPAESPSSVECLERLEMPDYPPLGRVVGVQGVQTVKVCVSLNGRPCRPSRAFFKPERQIWRGPLKKARRRPSRTPGFRRPVSGELSRWFFTTNYVRTITRSRSSLSGRRITFG